jgi:hypothetical protein
VTARSFAEQEKALRETGDHDAEAALQVKKKQPVEAAITLLRTGDIRSIARAADILASTGKYSPANAAVAGPSSASSGHVASATSSSGSGSRNQRGGRQPHGPAAASETAAASNLSGLEQCVSARPTDASTAPLLALCRLRLADHVLFNQLELRTVLEKPNDDKGYALEYSGRRYVAPHQSRSTAVRTSEADNTSHMGLLGMAAAQHAESDTAWSSTVSAVLDPSVASTDRRVLAGRLCVKMIEEAGATFRKDFSTSMQFLFVSTVAVHSRTLCYFSRACAFADITCAFGLSCCTRHPRTQCYEPSGLQCHSVRTVAEEGQRPAS